VTINNRNGKRAPDPDPAKCQRCGQPVQGRPDNNYIETLVYHAPKNTLNGFTSRLSKHRSIFRQILQSA
jgi:hypothetical protein